MAQRSCLCRTSSNNEFPCHVGGASGSRVCPHMKTILASPRPTIKNLPAEYREVKKRLAQIKRQIAFTLQRHSPRKVKAPSHAYAAAKA